MIPLVWMPDPLKCRDVFGLCSCCKELSLALEPVSALLGTCHAECKFASTWIPNIYDKKPTAPQDLQMWVTRDIPSLLLPAAKMVVSVLSYFVFIRTRCDRNHLTSMRSYSGHKGVIPLVSSRSRSWILQNEMIFLSSFVEGAEDPATIPIAVICIDQCQLFNGAPMHTREYQFCLRQWYY